VKAANESGGYGMLMGPQAAAAEIEEFPGADRGADARRVASEVLVERRGVCQDFAHVMIANNGPSELPRGAPASHAWCEADVAAVRGRYRGTAEQRMEVAVDVQRLDG